MKKVRAITILAVLGVLVVICLTGIYVVNPGEEAVVLTFGADYRHEGIWNLLASADGARSYKAEHDAAVYL